MVTILDNQMEDFCFESIHEDKKRKRKFNKRIDEISSELFIEF